MKTAIFRSYDFVSASGVVRYWCRSRSSGIKLDNAWALLAGGATWLVLQVSAVALESTQNDKERKNDH